MEKVTGYETTKLFEFNLLPERSREEIAKLVERDDSVLYSFILIFVSIFAYLLLNLIQLFLIDVRIATNNGRINSLNTQVESFDSIRSVNGELIRKSSSLKEALTKDIKPNRFIEISNQIVQGNGNILNYEREDSGLFVLNIRINNPQDAIQILERGKSNESLQNLYVRRIDTSNPGQSVLLLQFEITA